MMSGDQKPIEVSSDEAKTAEEETDKSLEHPDGEKDCSASPKSEDLDEKVTERKRQNILMRKNIEAKRDLLADSTSEDILSSSCFPSSPDSNPTQADLEQKAAERKQKAAERKCKANLIKKKEAAKCSASSSSKDLCLPANVQALIVSDLNLADREQKVTDREKKVAEREQKAAKLKEKAVNLKRKASLMMSCTAAKRYRRAISSSEDHSSSDEEKDAENEVDECLEHSDGEDDCSVCFKSEAERCRPSTSSYNQKPIIATPDEEKAADNEADKCLEHSDGEDDCSDSSMSDARGSATLSPADQEHKAALVDENKASSSSEDRSSPVYNSSQLASPTDDHGPDTKSTSPTFVSSSPAYDLSPRFYDLSSPFNDPSPLASVRDDQLFNTNSSSSASIPFSPVNDPPLPANNPSPLASPRDEQHPDTNASTSAFVSSSPVYDLSPRFYGLSSPINDPSPLASVRDDQLSNTNSSSSASIPFSPVNDSSLSANNPSPLASPRDEQHPDTNASTSASVPLSPVNDPLLPVNNPSPLLRPSVIVFSSSASVPSLHISDPLPAGRKRKATSMEENVEVKHNRLESSSSEDLSSSALVSSLPVCGPSSLMNPKYDTISDSDSEISQDEE